MPKTWALVIKLGLICMQILVAAANSAKLCRPEGVLSSSFILSHKGSDNSGKH